MQRVQHLSREHLKRITRGVVRDLLSLDDSMRNCISSESGNVMDLQDIHDFLPMRLDRFHADIKLLCNRFVGIAFGDQLEDFKLARSKSAPDPAKPASFDNFSIIGNEMFCNGRRKIGVAFVDLLDRSDQILPCCLLENVSRSPRLKNLAHIFFILMHGKNKDLDSGVEFFYPLGSLHSVENRHGNVEQNNVRGRLLHYLDRLLTIFGFSNDFKGFRLLEKGSKTLTDNRMIVSDNDSYFFHSKTC